MRFFITYFLYPILLSSIFILYLMSEHFDWDLVYVFGLMGAVRFALLLATEFLHPLRKEWKMTGRSFLRDLKWIAVSATIFGLVKLLMIMLTIDIAKDNTGMLSGYSVFTGLIVSLLIYEFFQYWYHRLSHTGKSPFRKWLWKAHIAHHLPREVYLLMHVVGHPINTIITLAIIQGSLLLVGARPESIFLFNAIMGLQGLVSHFNVDMRAGYLNYVLVGTELHRFHHSANIDEAKNYGAVITFWDIVFGTFYYRPGTHPEKLGVDDGVSHPESSEVLKVLALPFKR